MRHDRRGCPPAWRVRLAQAFLLVMLAIVVGCFVGMVAYAAVLILG